MFTFYNWKSFILAYEFTLLQTSEDVQCQSKYTKRQVFKRNSLYSNVSHRSLRFVSIEAERAQDEASSFIFEMANLRQR